MIDARYSSLIAQLSTFDASVVVVITTHSQVLGSSVVEVGGALVTVKVTRPYVRFAPDAVLAALV